MVQKIIIITAPSGSGKSSIAKGVMQAIPELQFSISAATRLPRIGEIEGIHYYFMSIADFTNKINNNEFAEWEKVYEGKYYGTLKSEINKIWQNNKTPVLDIDVIGAKNIISTYPSQTLSLFINVPLQELKKRLLARGTETTESLTERLEKAESEAIDSVFFDVIINNINLEKATQEAIETVKTFIQSNP
jgi:guanylate kinase